MRKKKQLTLFSLKNKKKVNEAKWTKKLIQDFRIVGWFVQKMSERFKSGFPDLILIKNNNVFFAEVKVGDKALTALQKFTLEEIAKRGGNALVIRNSDGVEQTVCKITAQGEQVLVSSVDDFIRG